MNDKDVLFQDDCYDTVLTVTPFGDPLPGWLMMAYEDRRDPDTPEPLGGNALHPEAIRDLRDALDAWLEDHPVRPDPFEGGGSVPVQIGDTVYDVSIVGVSVPEGSPS